MNTTPVLSSAYIKRSRGAKERESIPLLGNAAHSYQRNWLALIVTSIARFFSIFSTSLNDYVRVPAQRNAARVGRRQPGSRRSPRSGAHSRITSQPEIGRTQPDHDAARDRVHTAGSWRNPRSGAHSRDHVAARDRVHTAGSRRSPRSGAHSRIMTQPEIGRIQPGHDAIRDRAHTAGSWSSCWRTTVRPTNAGVRRARVYQSVLYF
jgi:hypothetical protein